MCWGEQIKIKKTRKTFRCEWCWQIIEKGFSCVRHRGITEGQYYTARLHPECDKDQAKVLDYCETYMPGEGERPMGPHLQYF